MPDEKWQKVREIFDSALRRKPEERRKFVRKACDGNQTLLAEVESLLLSHDSAESFMETPAIAKVADVIEAKTKKLEEEMFRALRDSFVLGFPTQGLQQSGAFVRDRGLPILGN